VWQIRQGFDGRNFELAADYRPEGEHMVTLVAGTGEPAVDDVANALRQP
jgi:hypothetical protein